MKQLVKIKLWAITICIFAFACSEQTTTDKSGNDSAQTESSHHNQDSPPVYIDSANPMLEVEQGLEVAKQIQKNLLLVMGAQWCHDSRGLAKRFHSKELATMLNESYHIVYLDVGYYKDLRNVTQRFSQAHYFATPTVMVINPLTEQLLNADTMDMWGSADSVSLQEYSDYFARYANIKFATQTVISEENKKRIEAFEKHQANRLMDAYEYLAPMMKHEKDTGEDLEGYHDTWREVRNFRLALQKDINDLYQQAKENKDKTVVLPIYEDFTWE